MSRVWNSDHSPCSQRPLGSGTSAQSVGYVSVSTKTPPPAYFARAVRGALWLAYGQQAVDEAIASCRSYREHNATKTAIVLDEDVYDIPAGVFDDRIVP